MRKKQHLGKNSTHSFISPFPINIAHSSTLFVFCIDYLNKVNLTYATKSVVIIGASNANPISLL